MRRWAADSARPLRLDVVGDYENAVAHVASGESAALGADDVLPAGYIAERGLLRLRCGWRTAVCEPYGITFAKDAMTLAEVVCAAFTRPATSGVLRSTYDRWFVRQLPAGVTLRWPMNSQLTRSFEFPGMAPE